MAYGLAENANSNGVEIYTKSKVERIEYRPKEPHRFCVGTKGEAYKARYLINAAGLFADDISRMLGVSDFTIKPRKGEEFLLDKKKEHMTNHLIFPLPSKVSKGILIIKTSDGNPMIGPTAEDVEGKDDLRTSDSGFRKVLESARRMVPSISKDDVIAYFAGLRPVAGPDFIIRHEADAPGFVNAAGMQSPGLTAAPAVALMVAGMLKENGLALKRKFIFRAHRKKSAHLFALPPKKIKKLIKKDPEYGDIVCRCEMVSVKEVKDAIGRGARTLDGIKFRTRAQAGRCHGGFCTSRLLKVLSEETGRPVGEITKRGAGSEIIKGARDDG
jgi:glycerol-3-phosphate dehydrogenase